MIMFAIACTTKIKQFPEFRLHVCMSDKLNIFEKRAINHIIRQGSEVVGSKKRKFSEYRVHLLCIKSYNLGRARSK